MSCVVMVWFRADRAHDARCHAALATLVGRVAQAHGVTARFGWRDQHDAAFRTWIEVYEPLPASACDDFAAALAGQASEIGLDALASNGRYVEVFEWAGAGARA